jgi:hypothetical protein
LPLGPAAAAWEGAGAVLLPVSAATEVKELQMKEISHSHSLAPALGLCLTVAGNALGAEHAFDGVYSGKRVLTTGSPSPMCPPEDDVSVTIHGETLTFTNSALNNFLQPFSPGQDGSFGQTYTDAGGAVVHYHGRIVGDVMDVDVDAANPTCEHHWHLKKE